MIHPGSNLLKIAQRVIKFQRVFWHQFAARAEDELGEFVSFYNAPQVIKGSWQPVNRARYEALGLDFARRHYNFFTANDVLGVTEGRGTDLIDYQGKRHEVVDVQPWAQEDGWNQVLVVEVGPSTALPPQIPPAEPVITNG